MGHFQLGKEYTKFWRTLFYHVVMWETVAVRVGNVHTSHVEPGKRKSLQVFQGRFSILSLVKYMSVIHVVDDHEPRRLIVDLEPVSDKLQHINPRIVPSRELELFGKACVRLFKSRDTRCMYPKYRWFWEQFSLTVRILESDLWLSLGSQLRIKAWYEAEKLPNAS